MSATLTEFGFFLVGEASCSIDEADLAFARLASK